MRKRVLVRVLHAYKEGFIILLVTSELSRKHEASGQGVLAIYTRTSKLGVADARQSYKYSAKDVSCGSISCPARKVCCDE